MCLHHIGPCFPCGERVDKEASVLKVYFLTFGNKDNLHVSVALLTYLVCCTLRGRRSNPNLSPTMFRSIGWLKCLQGMHWLFETVSRSNAAWLEPSRRLGLVG